MVTENQAHKSAMALAQQVKKQADSDWQLVVDKLKEEVAELTLIVRQLRKGE